MQLAPNQIEEIIVSVRQHYPDWTSFTDPDFVRDEITYKQTTVAKARDLLSKTELNSLINIGHFDEFITRLETVGKDINLLWNNVPGTGDLNILYHPKLDRPAFCQAMFDLLHGAGTSPERLGRYIQYVQANELPNKWTFPTYFLFICHPDSEIFVKPETTERFLQLIEQENVYSVRPTASAYAAIREIAHQLRDGLRAYRPRDMVDIQSLIWVSIPSRSSNKLIPKDKKAEFRTLFQEFANSYPATPDGQWHLKNYETGREQGRQNFAAIITTADQGEDITDQVLLKLLPYANSTTNRQKGAWIHLAPSINGDIKGWFEGAGWTKREDWPQIARTVLDFVCRCNKDAEELSIACQEISTLPYTKGFQTGMLTPILNALRPDDFTLINNKSRQVINHLANTKYSQKLTDYPAINTIAFELVEELAEDMQHPAVLEIREADRFDMFCHWLVAIKKYHFGSVRYWKIAPGENAWNWETCRDGGFIAIGWEEMGDVSGLSRAEFNVRRDELTAKHGDWNNAGVEQLWKFAHIKEGDRIVANHGLTQVLGIGTVVGPYEFVPGVRHGHRLPVEWDDLRLRQVNEPGWRRTLVELNRDKFDEIANAPCIKLILAEPFSKIFKDRQEAEWAFDFLKETMIRLGINNPDDQRFALTLPREHSFNLLRLNFGGWVVLDFWGLSSTQHRATVALFSNMVDLDEQVKKWGPFTQREDEAEIAGYGLSIEAMQSMTESLRKAYEVTFDYIAQRFQSWQKTRYRNAHQAEIAEAVFDLAKRKKLFDEGFNIKPESQPYSIAQCAAETGFAEDLLKRWIRVLKQEKQVILYGPPGTGKTYIAERLARHLIGGNDSFYELVQFHPAYAYEDFIQGIRPQLSQGGGLNYRLVPGRFLEFCERARLHTDSCVLIIDEINRANLSRVFGELMYLLENRDRDIPLAGGGLFSIPANVHIIGTMNTADRSIALVDHALRRRFAFLALYPSYEVLQQYHQQKQTNFPVENLIQLLRRLNTQINDPHYQVGISFFLRNELAAEIEDIWRMKIEPYLEEYFFDQIDKVNDFRWDKIKQQIRHE